MNGGGPDSQVRTGASAQGWSGAGCVEVAPVAASTRGHEEAAA